MALPKITKPTDLRDNLYKTLEEVAAGSMHIVPTKNGDVILLCREDYESLAYDKELMKDFDEPLVVESELSSSEDVFKRLDKKFGITSENKMDKARGKKSR